MNQDSEEKNLFVDSTGARMVYLDFYSNITQTLYQKKLQQMN